jgi:hypothetical protein
VPWLQFYGQFKQAHAAVVMSSFDQEDYNDEMQAYEFPTA